MTGRGKLNGLHAGLILLTPVGGESHGEMQHAASEISHTPLEPPSSFLHTAFSAIKNVFSSVAPSSAYHEPPEESHHEEIIDHPPPPVQPFQSISWGAVNSYGDPASVDTYPDYDPRHPHQPFDVHASSKSARHSHYVPKEPIITPEKIQKIRKNINKALKMHQSMHRSSEELPQLNSLNVYSQMLMKGGQLPLFPTPVVTDAEIGVLSGELQPSPESSTTTTTTTNTSKVIVQSTTTESPRRKKDIKYILRGNRIVEV